MSEAPTGIVQEIQQKTTEVAKNTREGFSEVKDLIAQGHGREALRTMAGWFSRTEKIPSPPPEPLLAQKTEEKPETPKEKTVLVSEILNPEEIVSLPNLPEKEPEKLPPELAEKKELLKRPQDLKDAAYILLTMGNYGLDKVRETLSAFFEDRRAGQNQDRWEERIKTEKEKHESVYEEWREKYITNMFESSDKILKAGGVKAEIEGSEPEEDYYCIHCTNYVPRIENGKAFLTTRYQAIPEYLRTTVHFAFNHQVEPVESNLSGRTITWAWDNSRFVVMAPFLEMTKLNGNPEGMIPVDVWWGMGLSPGVELPEGTLVLAKKGDPAIEQLKQISGLKVVETETPPYKATNSVMQENGIRRIDKEFRGFYSFARKYRAEYAEHSGGHVYLGGERLIIHFTRSNEETIDNVANFNQTPAGSAEHFSALTTLISLGYFDPPGHNGVIVDFESNILGPEYDSQMPEEYKQRKKDLFRIYTLQGLNQSFETVPGFDDIEQSRYQQIRMQIGTLAQDSQLKLPNLSEGYLTSQIKKIKDELEIVPPRLIGALISENYRLLGLLEQS